MNNNIERITLFVGGNPMISRVCSTNLGRGFLIALLIFGHLFFHPVEGFAQAGSGPALGEGGIDVHVHLFAPGGPGGAEGGKGKGPGMSGPGGPRGPGGKPGRGRGNDSQGQGGLQGYSEAARNLIRKMDQRGVAKALLMPPPRTRENINLRETPCLFEVVRKYPGRLFVAAGGDVLNPMIQEVPGDRVAPEDRKKFVETAEGLVKSGIRAFGEMTALHFSFNDKHVFESVPPDHPLFLALSDIAGKYNLPVDLHMEAVQSDIPFPPGFDRRSSKNPPSLKANISGLERLLSHNRKAKIVWQHIGWDNTGHLTLDLLRDLLGKHPNLFLALRIENRLATMAGTPMPNRVVDRSGEIVPGWLTLFREFPDRFTIGTDEFCGPENAPGLFGNKQSPQSFNETWQFVSQLPKELAIRIGRENAARIYRL